MATTVTGTELAAHNSAVVVHGADASGNYLGLVDQATAAFVLFGPPPDGAGWLWADGMRTWVRHPTLFEAQTQALADIDAAADAIYKAVVGARGDEYQAAKTQAQAFATALYLGDAPASVANWAQIKGKSTRWAADNILLTAAQWQGAMQAIRSARLNAKEVVRTTTTDQATQTAMAQYLVGLAPIRASLGLPA